MHSQSSNDEKDPTKKPPSDSDPAGPPPVSPSKSTFAQGDKKEEKKEHDVTVGSNSPLAKAQKAAALAMREFYDAQELFHAAMGTAVQDQKETKESSTLSAPISLNEKMQAALREKLADSLVKKNYANFLLDYEGLHKNPFAGGLTIQVHKEGDQKDETINDPTTYSIENLAAQLEKMHKQISSEDFSATCKALVHSSTARGWVTLFVNQNSENNHSIHDDLIKPTQYLMRYILLLDAIKKETEKLIKIAKENKTESFKLEQALKELSKDQEKIKKQYIDPLQESINLLTISKILAYELIKDSAKETNSQKNTAMIDAAKKLRDLSSGAKYSDLFKILTELKQNGLKTKQYRKMVLQQSSEYKEEVLRNIQAYIPEIKHQENQADKDKKSDKVMESLINYMRALEIEWEVESQVEKYNPEPLDKIKQKIQIAKSHRESLEEIRKEPPLSVGKVADIIGAFKNALVKIDPKDTIVTQLRDIAGEYAVMVSPDLAGQKLNMAQLTQYLKANKTKIASQLFELKTPGDRRLGQLIAAQTDHLNDSDIEKLSAYIALRNDKNSKLSPEEKNKLYQGIQEIKNKLNGYSNELAVQQITAIKNAIEDASSNPQLLEKLGQALNIFTKNLNFIIVNDLQSSESTLNKIKTIAAAAKDALPPLSPSSPPPLDEKAETLLVQIELRQAILEKREALVPIPTKAFASAENEKLKSTYNLMLPSIIKKIDQDFITLVEKQVQYLEELESKYQHAEPCDILAMASPPEEKTLHDLKIQSDEAYIRSGDSLFYVNIPDKQCIKIDLSTEKLSELDKIKFTKTATTLTADELKQVAGITQHTRPAFKEKLAEKRTALAIEFAARKKYSSEEATAIIAKLLETSPPAEEKKIQESSKESQAREKKAALAMLELRQCLIQQKMPSRDLLVEDADLEQDKLLSDSTKEHYKALTKEYGIYRRENFDLAEYSKQIGNYRIGKKKGITEPTSAEEQKELALKILGEEGYRILHAGETDAKEIKTEVAAASTSARTRYLQYLQGALDAHHEQGDRSKLITMAQLLGEKGKNLYKAAIKEEMADPAFINAVFLKSVENFKGPKWKKKLVLWIAGPSSSGKSYVTNGMIERIEKWIMPKAADAEEADNYVVTIDGGMQRQVSKIRAITVDTSIELGYRGVKDVDKGLNGKLKGRIEHAASVKDDLSIAIPDTLTKYLKKINMMDTILAKLFKKNVAEMCEFITIQSGFNPKNISTLAITGSTAYVRSQDKLFYVDKAKNACQELKLNGEDLVKFDGLIKPTQKATKLTHNQLKKITGITKHTRRKEILHVYSQVTCGKSDEEARTFELAVGRMGESRAFLKIGKTHYSIILDGVTIIESKKYDRGKGGINFSLGKRLAKQGKEVYRAVQGGLGEISYDFDVTHDLMFITFDITKKQWRECTPEDQDHVKMITRRAFKAYQATHPTLSAAEDPYEKLDTWLKDKNGGNKPTLRDPIIEYYENGKLKDHETENLLKELEKLQAEANDFLKEKNSGPRQFSEDEKENIQQYYTKVSALILAIKESQARKDKINVWKDHQEEIGSIRKAHQSLKDKIFSKRMEEIGYWLNIEASSEPRLPLKEPVDLATLGVYIANSLSKSRIDPTDEQKKELNSIISHLQDVPRENPASYIKEQLDRLAKLNIQKIKIEKFKNMPLAYAAAKKRDAMNAILDRKQIGDPENTKEKATACITAYLNTLAEEWKLEAIVKGDYTTQQNDYNNDRLKLLAEAVSNLDKASTLSDIQTICGSLKESLSALPTQNSGLTSDTEPLQKISTQYIAQVKAQLDTRASHDAVIKIMDSAIPDSTSSSTVDKYIAGNIQKYLEALEHEWQAVEKLQDMTAAQKEYNKTRLEALTTATTAVKSNKITLQKIQETLDQLKTAIKKPEGISKDNELARQTEQAACQLEKLHTDCIAYRYKAWLKSPLTQAAGEPEINMSLADLGRYIAHLIKADNAIKDTEKEEFIMNLQDQTKYSGDDAEKRNFIYKNLPGKFKNDPQIKKLFVGHAQAIRRDLQAKITKQRPEDIIKISSINIDQPETYCDYIAKKMIEYLKSIEAEWTARELMTGASYKEHKEKLQASITALEKPPSTLEAIQDTLKQLGGALKSTPPQPTNLGRMYILASRFRKKPEKPMPDVTDDIASLTKMDEHITLFMKAVKEDEEQEKEIKKTKIRKMFLTGRNDEQKDVTNKHGVAIHGTNAILTLFGEKIKAERKKTEYKAEEALTTINLSGWDIQKLAEIKEPTTGATPSLAAKTTECHGLPSGMYIEYKLQQDNTATIRESYQNNDVNIGAPVEPSNYHKMSEKEKLAIDITIAEAMVRLWIARCGTPVHIADSFNASRMKALIIVCEAHDLHYELPYFSMFNHSFLNNPKVELEDNIAALEKDIRDRKKIPIKVLNQIDGIQELETKFAALKTHYEEELKTSTTLPEKERQRYAKEIHTIGELIDNAKKGKYNAKAANDAVMELNKSLEEINHPVARSSLRKG